MSEESRMKKTIIRIAVCVVVFLASALIIGSIMNQGHNNMTMEMAPATLPMITMESGGVACNELHGNTVEMDVAYQKDCITLLGEGRQANFTVDTFGREITGISTEVRSIDGSRLIENSEVTGWKANGKSFSVSLTLKDLIDTNTQYSLTLILELEGEQKVYYYTTILWNDDVHISEILEFATDFHGKLYDKEVAKELTKYLEPNSKLTDNGTFHKVNIHSSFQQITWGSLEPVQEDAASIRLTQISGNVASLLMDFVVSTGEGKNKIYYNVEEYYRVRYTSERMYLLDYERTMTQIPDTTRMYANDKILLGITDENVDMMESADGNTVVFSDMGQLLSYNAATNGLTVIFSFYDKDNADRRTLYDNHGIKILDVDEGGNVKFAVYGYMNRGRHEGETGIQIISYDNSLNTIEEEVYIPYSKSYTVLKDEMEQLLYRNRQQHVYFFLENGVYDVDLENRSAEQLVSIRQDDSLQVSENHEIIVWQEGDDINHSNQLNVRNLNTGEQTVIRAEDGEAIRPLGFMGEDIIYGVARESDIRTENSGQIFYPMYKVCISNSSGDNLKEYGQDGIYIVDCAIEGNQITLSRIQRSENGSYQEILDDQIMNNVEEEPGQNKVVTADIDIYERYVQIQTKTTIDTKTIKVLNPKEVVFEGGRELTLDAVSEVSRYYVYNAYGVQGIYSAPGKAVKEAYDSAGVVANDRGITVWLKGNRVSRNQIMAIKEESVTDQKNSLTVCLDNILRHAGITRNTEYDLAQGKTAIQILEENMTGVQVLDLSGCSLDAVLYYVNQDIPVLAILEDGEAVLVTGFNEFNVVIMEPSTGKLYKKGMNDATTWFAENGNHFISYMKIDN
jgi:virulence-associated protein VapD